MIEWLSGCSVVSCVLHTCAHVWFFGSGYFFCSQACRLAYARGRRDGIREALDIQIAGFEKAMGELEAQISTSEREDFIRH